MMEPTPVELSVMEEMIEMTAESALMNHKHFPTGRFFVPTPAFWAALKDIKEHHEIMMFIDCGTGVGDLPEESMEKGIRMAGVDVYRREGNPPGKVHIMPAHMMPFRPDMWPLVCRPDHSGWTWHLWHVAQEKKLGFIYVGDAEKMRHDLRHDITADFKVFNVGEDDETLFAWFPS